jgi:hypothetical protein
MKFDEIYKALTEGLDSSYKSIIRRGGGPSLNPSDEPDMPDDMNALEEIKGLMDSFKSKYSNLADKKDLDTIFMFDVLLERIQELFKSKINKEEFIRDSELKLNLLI